MKKNNYERYSELYKDKGVDLGKKKESKEFASSKGNVEDKDATPIGSSYYGYKLFIMPNSTQSSINLNNLKVSNEITNIQNKLNMVHSNNLRQIKKC